MRIVFAALVLIAASAVTPAQAQNYPWCAMYGGDLGGASSCSFVTFEQCRATVSGVGGYCSPNPSGGQVPGGSAPRPRRRS